MQIDMVKLDTLEQRVETVGGVRYARTYSGAELLEEDELVGLPLAGPLPGEIQEVFAVQRQRVLFGGDIAVTKENPVTGGIAYSTSVGADLITPEVAKSGLLRFVTVGDSMTAGNSHNSTITSITRTNNVATVVCTGHGRGTGEICSIYNCSDSTFNLSNVAVTRVDANTLTYPCPGADGSAASISGTKTMQLKSPAWSKDSGYLFWLQSKCGGALKLVNNAGRSGTDSADMLSSYDTDVISAEYHDAVIIMTGYNDWANANFSAATVYANVTAMVKKSVGKLVVVVSSIPYTTNGTYGSANRGEAIKYNRAIRNFCNGMRNVRYADAAKYLIDATHATKFSPLSNMLQADGIHPSPKGAERIAQAIYDAIQYEVPRVSRLVSSSGDNYGADSTNPNILDAAPWTTSGGALAGGATGTAATGIAVTNTGSGTVVASVVSRSDGVGYDQQVVFTPAANNDSVTFSGTGYLSASRYSVGNKVNYIGELVLSGMSGANIKSVEIWLQYQGSSGMHYLAKAQATGAATYPNGDMTISFASLVDSVICNGASTGLGWNVVIKAGAAGTALTAKLGRQSIEKV